MASLLNIKQPASKAIESNQRRKNAKKTPRIFALFSASDTSRKHPRGTLVARTFCIKERCKTLTARASSTSSSLSGGTALIADQKE